MDAKVLFFCGMAKFFNSYATITAL